MASNAGEWLTVPGSFTVPGKDEKKLLRIPYGDLDMTKVVGVGGFGVVYRAMWKSQRMIVAIKKIQNIGTESQRLGEKEVRLLNSLDHPYIVRFYGIVINKPVYVAGDTFVVIEFADNGSLDKHIQQHKEQPNFEQSLKWAKQVAQAMQYLHERNITHRDLKSSNVLLTSDYTAKICDLGSARVLDHTIQHKSIVGTHNWAAPEILANGSVNKSCDVYSYGILLWELCTHKIPYAGISHYMVPTEVLKGKRPPLPDVCEPYLAMLMSCCWKENAEARPTFSHILHTLEAKVYSEPSYYRELSTNQSVEISYSDLEFVERLGEDETGTTHWKGRWKSKHLVVSICRGRILGFEEVKTLGTLHHPNVILFYGTAQDTLQDLYGVTEHMESCRLDKMAKCSRDGVMGFEDGEPGHEAMKYAENGSLFSFLHEKKRAPSKDQCLQWARQIAEGMLYLHDRGIIHYDLKSNRIFLAADLTAKIFPCISCAPSALTTMTKMGSYMWSAPEVLKGEDCEKSSNVFSYGMILWEIVAQDLPFSNVPAISVASEIISGKRPPIPESSDAIVAKLIGQCWKGQPQARPTFDMVLQVLNDVTDSTSQQADLLHAQMKQLEILQTVFECTLYDLSSLQLEVDTKRRLLHKSYY